MATKPDKKVVTSKDVLRGHLQGAAFATSLINKGKKSSGGGKKGKAKIRVKYPPEGGWK
jgi:hypothetical protein